MTHDTKEHEGSLEGMKTLYYVIIGWVIIQIVIEIMSIKCWLNIEFLECLLISLTLVFTVVRFCQGTTLAFRKPLSGVSAIFEWWGFIAQAFFLLLAAFNIRNANMFFLFFTIGLTVDSIWLYTSMNKDDLNKYCLKINKTIFGSVFYLTIFILIITLASLKNIRTAMICTGIAIIISPFALVFYFFSFGFFQKVFPKDKSKIIKTPTPLKNSSEIKEKLPICYIQWLASDFVVIPVNIVALGFLSIYDVNYSLLFKWIALIAAFMLSFLAMLEDYSFGGNLYTVGSESGE